MQLSRELLKIKDLSVCYGATEALNGVNLVVCSDDFIGVIGPNGGGKSTLVKAILGLVHCSSGTIEFVKNELRIGYLPQSNTIDRQFPINVRDVILSGSRQKRTAALRDRLEQLLAQIAIKPLVRRSISALSGGQLQKVLLCRALIDSPELLILDEPTTYVDNKFEKEFYEILSELSLHTAIIMVSHDVGTISTYVKTIACVNGSLHYHPSNIITNAQLVEYDCPIQLLTHGKVPHTVLMKH